MAWIVDEKQLSDSVAERVPDGWLVRVFQVTSGDSGKEYWVHLMNFARRPAIILCNCPDATFKMPLVVMGVHTCKHGQAVLSTL